jgi:hypothetical protein
MTFRSLPACFIACFATACEDNTSRTAPAADASISAAPSPPPREGCARVGPLDAVENDPGCVVRRANEEAMREAIKHLAIGVTVDPPELNAGGMGLLGVTIRNTAPTETTVLFDARTRLPGPRPDWSRVLGIPEPKEPHLSTPDSPKLFFPATTTDSSNRDVDALPMIPGSGGAPSPATVLGVHLRPGGKLTHNTSWWALRIPAPASVVQDEAGHRYVPKTAALSLSPGEYVVVVELPLFGLTREERKFSTRVRVIRAPLLDAGPSSR